MQAFTVAGTDYDESIVLCMSHNDGVVITTAVSAKRSEEPELLHALMESTSDTPYVPFSEDRYSEVESDRELYEATIDANATCLSIAARPRTGPDQTQTHLHAVNATLLLEELLPAADNPIVISTANSTHATELLRSIASDGCSLAESPEITHSPKMWWYYPTAMVGGLTCKYLSHRFSEDVIPDIWFNIPIRQCGDSKWSSVDSGRAKSTLRYQQPQQATGYGTTEAERIYCWYAGLLPTANPAKQVEPTFDEFRDWTRETNNARFLSLLRMFR